MLHLVFGADEYGSALAIASLRARFQQDQTDRDDISRLDGAAVTWPALRDACASLSLFADHQVVLVRGLLAAWSGRGDGAGAKQSSNRPAPADFARFAAELPESTELLLHEGDLSATNRFLKELRALPANTVDIQIFAMPQRERERDAWAAGRVREMVEQRGGSIDGDAARLLAQRCAGDLLAASHEVDKLLAYTAPLNSIFAADVRLVVVDSTEASVFTIVDAVCGKKAAPTVDLADRLLAENVAPEQILALVGARIHDLVVLAAARRERIANQEAAHRAAWEPWRLGRVEPWLASYSNDELAGAQSILVAADLALKSRPSHERPLIALLALLALARRSDAKALKTALAY